MSQSKALISRWNDALSDTPAQALSQGDMISPFGVHEVAGRLLPDFRGLQLDDLFLQRHPIQGIRLADADFSDACMSTLGNRVAVQIAGCRFDKTQFEGNLGVIVTDSSFRHARMDRVQFYAGSSFSDCDFSHANLYAARTYSSAFHRCRFDAATLSQASLIDCDFLDCRWEGVRFAGTNLSESWISLPGFPGPFDAQGAGEAKPEQLEGLQQLDLSDLDEGMGVPTEQELLALMPVPTLILNQVHWMDPADPETLLTGSMRRRRDEARAQALLADRQSRQIPILSAAREAFRQGDYTLALAQLAEAEALCPLPASAASLLRLARRRTGESA